MFTGHGRSVNDRLQLIAGDGRSRSLYGLVRGVWYLPGQSRLRLFDHLARVRDERRFDTPEALRRQIAADIEQARRLLS